MKFALSTVLIIMITAGASYAQPEEQPVKQGNNEKIEKTTKKERQRRMRSKSYSRQLNSVLARSSRLVSDDSQRVELMKIRNEVVPSLAKKEREYKRAKSQILNLLSNADFDAAEVKKEFKKTQDLQTAIFDEYLQGLTSIKNIIGDEGYNAIYTMRRGQYKKQMTVPEETKDDDTSGAESEKKPAEEDTKAD